MGIDTMDILGTMAQATGSFPSSLVAWLVLPLPIVLRKQKL
jgi:hypothetical protein